MSGKKKSQAKKELRSVFDANAERCALEGIANAYEHMSLRHANTRWTDEYSKLQQHGTNTSIAENSPLGDGDQSPLRSLSKNGEFHRGIFSCGGDIDDIMESGDAPEFFQNCMVGNVMAVQAAIDACKTDAEKHALLETRIGIMRFSPLFLTISGLAKVRGPPELIDHVATAKALLDAGARPEAKDLLGKNAMFYICGPLNSALGSAKFFAIGDLLIEAGNRKGLKIVDSLDRFHAVPMIQAIQMMRSDICSWLVKHQADPNIADDSGCSPVSMSRLIPSIFKIVSKPANAAVVSRVEADAPAEAWKERGFCWQCKVKVGESLCSGCGEAKYCSPECQKVHWKEGQHKAACKLATFTIEPDPKFTGQKTMSLMGGKSLPSFWRGDIPKSLAVGEIFEVKIQVGTDISAPFLIYDEERTFAVNVRSTRIERGEELFQLVAAYPAWGGRKAYLRAKFSGPGKLVIFKCSPFARMW
jgi:hypothetical protein